MTTPSTILLIDSDDHSAELLAHALGRPGPWTIERTKPGLAVRAAVAGTKPDLVVYNHHFDRPDDLLSCSTAMLTPPQPVVLAIAAAGPSQASVRRWAAETGHVASILQKPLADGALRSAAEQLIRGRQASRALQERSDQLASMLPPSALTALQAGGGLGQEEMFEAAVLFTDVRRSSDLITRTAPREFFQGLNRTLGEQALLVRSFEGEVIKYTGDGLLAVFRGMARSYLALRCALDLAAANGRSGQMPYGVGVAEGLVLGGLVGTEGPGHRRQYDVIGATVHLAARLCALAGAGEVMTTQKAHAASRIEGAALRPVGPVEVRGFPGAIECVAFRPGPGG